MAANVRKAVAEGRSDAVPIFLGDIYLLFERKIIQPDVAIIQVYTSLLADYTFNITASHVFQKAEGDGSNFFLYSVSYRKT